MYKNRINNPNSPIVLDTVRTAIFLTFDESMQKLLFDNYDLKMKGLKPSFSNSVKYSILIDAIQHYDSTQSKQHVLRLNKRSNSKHIKRSKK